MSVAIAMILGSNHYLHCVVGVCLYQACGRRIAYAPVVLPDGTSCAMSAHGGAQGLIVEIDRLGTAIPGRGVVRERDPVIEQERIAKARRAKNNRR